MQVMKLERRLLTWDEIEARLTDVPGWRIDESRLAKTFEFATYLDGVAFVDRIAGIAEEMDHHPDLLLTYRKVAVSVNTHDVGGISPLDFELARRVQLLS